MFFSVALAGTWNEIGVTLTMYGEINCFHILVEVSKEPGPILKYARSEIKQMRVLSVGLRTRPWDRW